MLRKSICLLQPNQNRGPKVDPLTQCAIKHGTDKWGMHFYTPHYHRILGHLKDEKINILEIGVGGYDNPNCGGLSLLMWKDYFANGQITGFDIHAKKFGWEDRINLVQGDQSNPEDLLNCVENHGPFDVIIDDGSHIPEHIFISFETLFPTLKEDGIYIIEDTQTSYMRSFRGQWPGNLTNNTVNYFAQFAHGLNYKEIELVDETYTPPNFSTQISEIRFLHNMIVLTKSENIEPSNLSDMKGDVTISQAIQSLKELEQKGAATFWTKVFKLILHANYGSAEEAIRNLPKSFWNELKIENENSIRNHAETLHNLSKILTEVGSRQHALQVVEMLCEVFPENTIFQLERFKLSGVDDRKHLFENIVKKLEVNSERVALIHYHELSELLLDDHLFEQAKKICDHALIHFPSNPAARLLRAKAFYGLGQNAESLLDLHNNNGGKYGSSAVEHLLKEIGGR